MVLSTKYTHQTVHGGVDLGVEVATLLLAKGNSVVDQTLVSGLVSSRENEGWVGGGILGFVDIDCYRSV